MAQALETPEVPAETPEAAPPQPDVQSALAAIVANSPDPLAGATRLTLRGTEREGVLTIDEAVVDNPRLNATAQGRLGAGQTDVTAQLRADSLAFLGRGIGGGLNATARLTDTPQGRRVTA